MESGGDHHHAITIWEESNEITELPNGSPPPNQRGEESIGESSVARMQRLLNENTCEMITQVKNAFICRVPQSLRGISSSSFDIEPETVSIGPYHRGKEEELEFESYKWQFLRSLLSRAREKGVHLHNLIGAVQGLESQARDYYSEIIQMSSEEFVEMLVLDGCFIIEIFHQVSTEENRDNILIFLKPCSIPILCRDLLKLENQLPFFVLQHLFDLTVGITGDPLCLLVLKFFNLVLPASHESLKKRLENIINPVHLLQVFHSSYSPESLPDRYSLAVSQVFDFYQPLSDQSMPCVTKLRLAGMKFRPRDSSDNFLDIRFHKGGVLQIPPITINDFTTTVFINCAAFEQCSRRFSRQGQYGQYFSEYIAFMSCLITSARDVTFLCDDRIITNFSHNDPRVAVFFKKLGENVVFNVRECYLSSQFSKVEAYYVSNRATLRRTYFSNTWTLISVISASLLLVFTAMQTLMAILSFRGWR